MKALSALEAEQSSISALLMTSMAQQERKKNGKSDERLVKASTNFGMEISAEKTKLMSRNTCGINTFCFAS